MKTIADAGPFVLDVNGTTTLVAGGLAAGAEARVWVAGYRWPDQNAAMIDSTFMVDESDEDNNAFNFLGVLKPAHFTLDSV